MEAEETMGVPVKSERRINRIVYILLALFLGTLGIHRFAAGHWFAGLCYLFWFYVGSMLTLVFGLGLIILAIEELVCLYDIVKATLARADAAGEIAI